MTLLKYIVLLIVYQTVVSIKYEPNWDSLDTRPLPQWYDQAKLGIFIHFGVFSVPSFDHVPSWFWKYWHDKSDMNSVEFMKKNYPPRFTYQDFAAEFTAEFFNAEEWAEIFNASGAKYAVLTTKHCDGFTLWPSKTSFNWNSNSTGPKRDIVGEFSAALRKKSSLKVGLYHCLQEWFNPLYLKDKESNYTGQEYVKFKVQPALYELINNYKPEVLWSDMCELKGPAEYYKSQEFLAWLYNESPVKDTVVTNDRWCETCFCKHGGYFTCADKFNPGVVQKHKFEGGLTIDRDAWAYRRNVQLSNFLSPHDIISNLVSIVSCGGNMILDVGPTKEGKITPIFEERLRQLGQWLRCNGEGIYSTVPWSHQKDTTTRYVWYTMKKTDEKFVYAVVLSWPQNNTLTLGAPITSTNTIVTMLGYPEKFQWTTTTGAQGLNITIPNISWNKLPCQWAWTFKLTNIQN
ncbi:alpha-L-fucosidase-like [Mytilus galloprovincialis]|uniref:alpha-L-fucosidase-like n=1 Tax=Mytilus galloprovincialis TaxID=29158 RepID=UPI003F7CC935